MKRNFQWNLINVQKKNDDNDDNDDLYLKLKRDKKTHTHTYTEMWDESQDNSCVAIAKSLITLRKNVSMFILQYRNYGFVSFQAGGVHFLFAVASIQIELKKTIPNACDSVRTRLTYTQFICTRARSFQKCKSKIIYIQQMIALMFIIHTYNMRRETEKKERIFLKWILNVRKFICIYIWNPWNDDDYWNMPSKYTQTRA